MGAGATPDQTEHVLARLQEAGVEARVQRGREATVIGAIGERELLATLPLEGYPGVEQVLPILKPYKLVAREVSPDPTVIEVDGRRIGDGWFGLIAGPVLGRVPRADAGDGARGRGGGRRRCCAAARSSRAPRRTPSRGSARRRSTILREAREETGLPVVTELMDPRHVEAVLDVADVIQIGARNMQNFLLLAEVGRADKPVLLKRGPSTSVEELLMAAEYVAKEGNERIILCERGIKTFETATRYTLDLGAVAVLKHETHLPVIVDPSHAAGGATSCCRWRGPRPRWARTGSSSRRTRGPRRRFVGRGAADPDGRVRRVRARGARDRRAARQADRLSRAAALRAQVDESARFRHGPVTDT